MNTFLNRSITLLTGLSLFWACQSPETETTPTDKVALKIKKSARLDSGIDVRVDTLVDSRCPVGYNCFVAGWATADLSISSGSETQKRTLILGQDPKQRKDSTTVQFSGVTYKVVLRDVVPYPVRDERPEQQAIIQVAKL